MKKKEIRKYNITKYLPVFVILLAISIIVGSTFAYFTDRKEAESELTFSKVELSSETTTGINGVIYDALPGMKLVDGALKFSKSIDSEPIYVRAKLSYSLPVGANAGMSAILEALRNADGYTIEDNLPFGAKWSEKEGNYFYLLGSDDNMFKVDTIDTYTLTHELVIPRDLEALDGNVQYMESVNFHVAFEAIQADNISTNINDIKAMFKQVFPENEAEVIRYSVVINNQGESQTQVYEVGDVIESLEAPTKDGYEFVGWYSDNGYDGGQWGEEIVFPYTVRDNVTMFARYEEVASNKVVYYNEDLTTVYQEVELEGGAKATNINYEVETNEVFMGWFTDTTFETLFDFGATIKGSTELYPLVKQATNPSDFVFNESIITKYSGTDSDVVIPASYSIDGYIEKSQIFEDEYMLMDYFYMTPTFPAALKDGRGRNYIVDSLMEYEEIMFRLTYPVTLTYDAPNYVYGDEYEVSKIATNAILVNDDLINLYIGYNIKTINEAAISECMNLKTITISAVENLGLNAIAALPNLEMVGLGNELKCIEDHILNNLPSLKSLHIPTSVDYIASNIAYGMPNVTSLTVAEGNLNYYSIDNCIIEKSTKRLIHGTYDCKIPDDIKIIGDYAFNETPIAEIDFPSGLEVIGTNAFYNTNLSKIILPKSMKEIKSSAFNRCSNLADIEMYDSDILIANQVFDNTAFYKDTNNWVNNILYINFKDSSNRILVKVDPSVTSIPNNLFNNVTAIAGYALYNVQVDSLSIPNGVKIIGDYAFYNMSISSITLPNTITIISDCAFMNCKNLTSLTLPESLQSIGYAAFFGCSKLTSLYIPSSVVNIDWGIFYNNTTITSISVSNQNEYYHVENNCLIESKTNTLIAGLGNVQIPDYVTSIADYAFYSNINFTTFEIPDNVTYIGYQTFAFTALQTLDNLPSKLETIEEFAFYAINTLSCVVIPENIKEIKQYAFSSCYNLNTVYIDSADVALNMLDELSQGSILEMVTNIYVKTSITTVGSYLTKASNTVYTYNGTSYYLYNKG